MLSSTPSSTEEGNARPSWPALESNPEAFNQYIEKLGITGVQCQELYGLEPELLSFAPGPHYALIYCFPCSAKADAHFKQIYANLEAKGEGKVPHGVFFMRQKIRNACGTFSLLHSLTNNLQHLQFAENCPFRGWHEKAKALGVQDRSDCLFQDKDMATAHQNCAQRGETDVPEVDKVEFHFIAYLNWNGRLLEFDSSQNFPRDCGPTSAETMLQDAGKECLNLATILDDIRCNALVLNQKQRDA